MPFRKYAATPLDRNFREKLYRWARKLVCSDLAANRVVQRTIDVLCHDPELLEGRDVNETIFVLLRRYAFDENDRVASRISLGGHSVTAHRHETRAPADDHT